eukprot:1196055-Prorocentrum_minimum.AAC.6
MKQYRCLFALPGAAHRGGEGGGAGRGAKEGGEAEAGGGGEASGGGAGGAAGGGGAGKGAARRYPQAGVGAEGARLTHAQTLGLALPREP